jgi:hypothetical protein
MSERVWGWIGRAATIVAIAAGITTIVWFANTFNVPSSRLVADIRPMAFRLPITTDQLGKMITELTKTDKPVNQSIGPLLQAGRALSLVKIDLHNNGDLPIHGIHIDLDLAVLYATGSEGVDDSQVLTSDQSGITLENLIQGNSVTIYVWAGFKPEYYGQRDKIRISYAQGTASKNIYTECLARSKL